MKQNDEHAYVIMMTDAAVEVAQLNDDVGPIIGADQMQQLMQTSFIVTCHIGRHQFYLNDSDTTDTSLCCLITSIDLS